MKHDIRIILLAFAVALTTQGCAQLAYGLASGASYYDASRYQYQPQFRQPVTCRQMLGGGFQCF